MITTHSELRDLVAHARTAGRVALDTEFVWERTFYPRLGLVQVGLSEQETYLVDPVALGDLTPLGALLADASVRKLLHDAQQDLVILRRATGALPSNVFDTRLAAGFVGLPATLSLQALLNETLGVDLPKGQQRSNWLQRPLTEEQQAYARDDVRNLPRVYDVLVERIARLGREAWVAEEMTQFDDPDRYEDEDPRERYRSVKGRGKRGFSGRDYAVLREVAAWREEEARRRDRPRGHIVPDQALVDLARHKPRGKEELEAIEGLSGRARERYGAALIAAVRRGLEVPREAQPHRTRRPRLDDTLSPRLDLAQALLKGRGVREALDPALVANRADMEALVVAGPAADPQRHAMLRGWRRDFIGDDLLALFRGEGAVELDAETQLPRLRRNGQSR